MTPPIISFIGWHDSGKTTLATQVVAHLRAKGYHLAVIKSSKDQGIAFDSQNTDTDKHRRAGAEAVLFVAPDQMAMLADTRGLSLPALAQTYFPEMDLVIGEGFKEDPVVAKIEVVRDPEARPLRLEVPGVVAVASDLPIPFPTLFRLDQSLEIAAFIEQRLLDPPARSEKERLTLVVNGRRQAIDPSLQEALAGTLAGFLDTLRLEETVHEVELRLTLE